MGSLTALVAALTAAAPPPDAVRTCGTRDEWRGARAIARGAGQRSVRFDPCPPGEDVLRRRVALGVAPRRCG
ncbi:MAG TPA: hypothetical protein VF529_05200 [Solirubrobacteraceae bacterium]